MSGSHPSPSNPNRTNPSGNDVVALISDHDLGGIDDYVNSMGPLGPGSFDDSGLPIILEHEWPWIEDIVKSCGPGSLDDIAERLGLYKDPLYQPSAHSPDFTGELPSCSNRDIPSQPGLSIHNSVTQQGLDTTTGELQQPRDPTQFCNPCLNQPNASPQQCLETTDNIPIWRNQDSESISRQIQSTARELQLYNLIPVDERSGWLPSSFHRPPDGSAHNAPNWNGESSSGTVQLYNQDVEEENFLRWFHASFNQPTKGSKDAAVGNKDSGGGSQWAKDPMGFCRRYLTDDDFRVWFHRFLKQSNAHSQHTSDTTGNLYPPQMGFSVNKAPGQPDVPPKQHLNTTGVDEGTNEDSAIQVKRTLVEQREFTKNLKLSDVSAYFHLTMEKASDELAIGTTALRTACRRLGLKRWPQKELSKIKRKIEHLEKKLANREHSNDDTIRTEILKLRQKQEDIIRGPIQAPEQEQSDHTDGAPNTATSSAPGGQIHTLQQEHDDQLTVAPNIAGRNAPEGLIHTLQQGQHSHLDDVENLASSSAPGGQIHDDAANNTSSTAPG